MRRVRISFRYRPDLRDPALLTAAGNSLMLATLFAVLAGWVLFPLGAGWGVLGVVAGFCLTLVASAVVATLLAGAGSRGAMSFLAPSGRSTPSQDEYSLERSLLVRGKVDEALRRLEVRLANDPGNVALCLLLAETTAGEARRPAEAERLFVRARELPGATDAQEYHATNRLIDLYLGPLARPDAARAELERVRTRHPGSDAAAHAAAALRQLESSR